MSDEKTSVFNPVEQRLFGLVEIAQGVLMLFMGKHAPSLSYIVALKGVRRAQRRRQEGKRCIW